MAQYPAAIRPYHVVGKSVEKGLSKQMGEKVGQKVGQGESSLLGKKFGRLGTVIQNPNIGVKILDEGGHYLTAKINRMVPSVDVISTLKNPSVVLPTSKW